MIKNFELITHDLTDEEMELAEVVMKGLKTKTKENPIKGAEICKKLNEKGYNITEARLRKITNMIRSLGKLPIIATSKGYYCSYDKEEIENQIQSLMERANAIIKSAEGLKKFIKP
jgi:arginine repressor